MVLQELYAGERPSERRAVERLEHDFERVKRILTPVLADWVQAGKVLRQLRLHYRYERIGLARLTHDALIAVSAGRLGIRVLTSNERDFRRLAEFRPFDWQVVAV